MTALIAGSVDLGACGDKFFRPGRGARNKKYVALHAAHILLYAPASTSAETVSNFEKALSAAGHTPRAVRGMDGLASALAQGRYHIVIAPATDEPRLSAYLSTLPSAPQLVPMVDADKGATPEIERKYPHYLKSGADKVEIMEELDQVMSLTTVRAQR